tara:strand:- start:87 stop:1418 length:1332 start_codon:yes stop_codon:yes gene_type:complete
LSKKEYIVLLSLSSLIILCYITAGFFCHPSGDDFTYAVDAKNDNFLETVLNERQHWNGRYISNFIVLFSPLNWGGISGYKLMPLLLIGCIILGTAFFFKNVVGKHYILLSMVSTLITFSVMPDITEGIYWYTGAWTYIPGGVLFLVSISLIIKYWAKFKMHHYAILFVLIFLASGFNEVISLLGILTFSIALFKDIKNLKFLIFLLLFLALFTYIALAPGNSIRGQNFPDNHQIFHSFFMSCVYTARFIGEWLFNPLVFFWGIIILKMNFNSNQLNKSAFLRNPFFALSALIIPTFICCFGPIWSTGLLGQYRTANLACYVFLITYSLILMANKDYLIQRLKFNSLFKYGFIILVISLTLWKNQFFMFKELINGDISQFNQDMYDRYKIIQECKQPECLIPTIENSSRTLFVYPLKDDPDHWMNVSYQLYFNSGKIIKQDINK